jgi:hypothetical protein
MNDLPDPAAIFACAVSLRDSCVNAEEADSELNLGESYNGMDQFMREMMRIGTLFESWACDHVEFEDLNDVWPYLLEGEFGEACLKTSCPGNLAGFDESDCLRVSLLLGLPIRADGSLPIPVDVRGLNPIIESGFQEFRIQTLRHVLAGDEVVPFTQNDEPFDDDSGPPYFGLYGIDRDGTLEHIADRGTYLEARVLAQKLVPGLSLPEVPIT